MLLGFLLVLVSVSMLAQWFFGWMFTRELPPFTSTDEREVRSISVIIAARNEVGPLKRFLPVVLQQAYPDFEVLVVDDHSTDGTGELLRGFEAENTHMRVLQMPVGRTGKKEAIKLAVQQARHPLLVFTDADCCPASRRWLAEMAASFAAGKKVVLGYGPLLYEPGWLNRFARFETLRTAMQYFSFARAGKPYMGVGRNLAYHRKLYLEAAGQLSGKDLPYGDDDLLINAIATSENVGWCLHPDAFVYSEAPRTWKAYFQQKMRHVSTGKYYKRRTQYLLAAQAFSHFLLYASLVGLLVTGCWLLVAGCWLAYLLPAWYGFRVWSRQLKEADLVWWFPLLDVGLVLYHLVLSPYIFWKDKKEW